MNNLYKIRHNNIAIIYITLLFIIILGSFLRFYRLDSDSFSTIEATTVMISRMPINKIIHNCLAWGHFPTYYIVMHFWIKLFGEGEFSMRFIPVIFGTASIYIIFLISNKILNKKNCLIATFIFAMSPINLYWSQEAKMYNISSFFAIASVLFLLSALENNYIKSWIHYAFSFLLAFVFSFSSISALAFESLFVFLFYRKNKRIIKKFFITLFLIIAFLMPLILSLILSTRKAIKVPWDSFSYQKSVLTIFDLFGSIYPVNKMYYSNSSIFLKSILYYSPFFLLFLAFKGSYEIFSRSFQRSNMKQIKFLLLFWILIPILNIVFYVFLKRRFLENLGYIVFILGSYYILIAIGVVSFKKKFIRYLFLSVLFFCIIFAVFNYHSFNKQDKWRESVSYIEKRLRPDEIVFALERKGADNIRCYWKLDKDKLVLYPFNEWPLRGIDSKYKGVWFIWIRSKEFEDMLINIINSPETGLHFIEKKSFPYFIKVYHFSNIGKS